jgi:ATP-dependent Clp protease ATP-binding subunit ClpB
MSFDPNKLTESAATGLQAAIQLARDNAHSQVSPAHLLSALLTPSTAKSGTQTPSLFHSILNKGGSSSHPPALLRRIPPLPRPSFPDLPSLLPNLPYIFLNPAGASPDIVQRALAKFIVRLPSQDPPPDEVGLSQAAAKALREAEKIMKEKVRRRFLPALLVQKTG